MPIEVLAPLLGLAGAALGAAVQWLVSRSTIRAETERIYQKLRTEFELQQLSAWQAKFQSVMSELLAATDPELAPTADKRRVIPLVHRATLLLNPTLPSHAKVNDLVVKLALAVNGWKGELDMREVLSVHAPLVEAARALTYAPGRLQ